MTIKIKTNILINLMYLPGIRSNSFERGKQRWMIGNDEIGVDTNGFFEHVFG